MTKQRPISKSKDFIFRLARTEGFVHTWLIFRSEVLASSGSWEQSRHCCTSSPNTMTPSILPPNCWRPSNAKHRQTRRQEIRCTTTIWAPQQSPTEQLMSCSSSWFQLKPLTRLLNSSPMVWTSTTTNRRVWTLTLPKMTRECSSCWLSPRKEKVVIDFIRMNLFNY